MSLTWKLLKRDWSGGQLKLIALALITAVTVVTAVTLVAERIEQALLRETSSFLAADLVIRSSKPVNPAFTQKADESGLDTAEVMEFTSMLFRGDDSSLSSVKAVSKEYPLRGGLTVSDTAFAESQSAWTKTTDTPHAGEVWVNERLLPTLNANLGDALDVGKASLNIKKVLIAEPDNSSGFGAFAARAMMNIDDIEKSAIVQPGSRVRYKLLLAGEPQEIKGFMTWVKTQLSVHESIRTPYDAQEGIRNTMDRGQDFLLLAGSVGVLLAAIALALASLRYASRHTDQVALLKSWGESATRVRRLYFGQIFLLAIISTVIGLALGWCVHWLLLQSVADLLPPDIPVGSFKPLYIAFFTGFACLLGFTLPALWHLPSVSPLKVLRRDLDVSSMGRVTRLAIGLLVIIALVLFYSGSVLLTGLFILGLFAIASLTGLFAYAFLRLGMASFRTAGSSSRLAFANLWRHRSQTVLQIIAFAGTLLLLLIMVTLRTSLLDDWQAQIPENAPNHFFVNVAEHEVPAVESYLDNKELDSVGWYALVRARMTEINGVRISEEIQNQSESLRREVNLSTATSLPQDNQILSGQWLDEIEGDAVAKGVSVEEDVARDLGLKLGDTLGFSVGGLRLESTVTSIRSVKWENMQPNFYFLFDPDALTNYPNTSITAAYIPRLQKTSLHELLRDYPTIAIIDLDEIIGNIRKIIDRVSLGLEMMLLMILACGLLVMNAVISSSFDERQQESAVLRTLGGSRKQLMGMLGIEFISLGLIAGLIAALGAEVVVYFLQIKVFNMDYSWHPMIWVLGPIAGAIVIGGLGLWRSYPLVNSPPMQSLRALG